MAEDEKNVTGDSEEAKAPVEEKKETETGQSENEGREEFLEEDFEEEKKEQKKMKTVLGFGIGILILAVVVLTGCVIYSQQMNQKLASQTEKLKEEYTKLRQDMLELASAPTAAPREADAEIPTSTPTPAPTATAEPTKPVENNFDAVEKNMREKEQQSDENDQKPEPTAEPTTTPDEQQPEGEGGEKVITTPENTEEFVTYEHYIEGKKFSFEYPSKWDGKVIFANVTNEDGTVVITCYQSGQYSDFKNSAQETGEETGTETGEIFHILVNKDPVYQAEENNQYKIAEKDGYCAYYEEPSGVTYDYVNHKEYAEDYKMVYESQAKVWRSFQFNS